MLARTIINKINSNIITVDNDTTIDRDDAISYKNWLLWIHITIAPQLDNIPINQTKYNIDSDLISNAISGNPEAEADLGWELWQKKNYKESAKWDIKAAKHGNRFGQKKAGLHFQRGLGVEKNNVEAVYWHELAAKQGDTYSMMNLAKIYKTGGFGVEKNLKTALMWTVKASKQEPAPEGITSLIKEIKNDQ